jgi:hypothetical protein
MKTRPVLLALSLAVSATACDMDLPPGDMKSPQYWGDVFLDKYADELVIGELEAGPTPIASPRPVLLITGVTIPAEWFEPMKARLIRDNFIPVVYEPPDLLSGDLFENSVLLGEVIDQVRADYGVEKVDILAECTGGLIARHYVQSLGGEAKVSRMVTFISPQHGLPKAEMAFDFAGWPALDDLTPGSDFLHAVNDAPMPEQVPITSIYTCTDEYIQPYETSIIPGAKNIGLGCDGTFVGHFQFFYDPAIYLVMYAAITEPLASDGEALDPPPAPGDADPPAVSDDDEEGEAADADTGADSDASAEANGCTAGGSSNGGGGVMLMIGAALVLVRRRDAMR